ncbi:MAG: hypothetical protein ABL924_01140 [Methyloglobulus sp.]
MDVIYHLIEKHKKQHHPFYQQEWWTKDRTSSETKQCVAVSQICIGLMNSKNDLVGFVRVLTESI